MNQPSEANILILADVATATAWAEMLRDTVSHVWLDPQEIPADRLPEVILTDRPQPDTSPWSDVGLVKIGAVGAADVQLPRDCAARELRLACRLLAQVVRLRREQRLASQVQGLLSVAVLTDPLTELANRRGWDATLADRLARLPDSRRTLCLAIVDLDHFKQVNDRHGHTAGDVVLRETARAIGDALREDDFVARLGGDEFGLLLWVRDEAAAATVVERVQTAIPSHLAAHGAVTATASAGYCLGLSGQAEQVTAEGLYEAADAALREAKRCGRNRIVRFGRSS